MNSLIVKQRGFPREINKFEKRNLIRRKKYKGKTWK